MSDPKPRRKEVQSRNDLARVVLDLIPPVLTDKEFKKMLSHDDRPRKDLTIEEVVGYLLGKRVIHDDSGGSWMFDQYGFILTGFQIVDDKSGIRFTTSIPNIQLQIFETRDDTGGFTACPWILYFIDTKKSVPGRIKML